MIREEAELAGQVRLLGRVGEVAVFGGPLVSLGDGTCLIAPGGAERVFLEIPLADNVALWRPGAGYELPLPPDWGGRADVSSVVSAPIAVLHDQDSNASVALALTPADEAASMRYGVSEESAAFVVELRVAASDRHRAVVIDAQGGSLADAIERITAAGAARPPRASHDLAYEPVYSTWYSFHDALDADSLLREARIARELGMGSLFLDYGWQELGDSRYFDGCGDWRPDLTKFPDLRGTVAELAELGMGTVLWIAPLLLGERSELYARAPHWAALHSPKLRTWVLDPRLPEVREHVVSSCLRLVRDYGIRGLKIDFIDAVSDYAAPGDTETSAEVAAATVAVLDAVRDALDSAGFEDVLIEYREPYVGATLASSGDVIRAGDCPGDFLANRRSILDLRLLGTGQVVHADMMMWDPELGDASVSMLLSNSQYAVPQLSMRLENIGDSGRRQLAAWIALWRANHRTALHGRLVGLYPQQHYPSAVAVLDGHALAVAWVSQSIIELSTEVRTATVINGSKASTLSVRLPHPSRIDVHDHLGTAVRTEELPGGVHEIAVPVGGSATLSVVEGQASRR